MSYFPMMVDLEGKKVLVVGGGKEGELKVQVLHDFNAIITLISIDATDKAKSMAHTLQQREFLDSDVDAEDYTLIVASTDDRQVNARISRLAKERKIPVNIVDDVELCTFIFPAIVKDGDVVCAVSSGGKSPYLVRHIKGLLKSVLPDNVGEINDEMGRIREKARKEIPDTVQRRVYLRERLYDLLNK